MSFLDYITNFLSNNKKNVRLLCDDLIKISGEKDALEVALYTEEDTPYPNQNIKFNINGVIYLRETDESGIARLNINLPVGKYEPIISFTNPECNPVSTSVNVIVNPLLTTQDYVMTEGEDNKFRVSLKDANGNPVVGSNVEFTVNGRLYNRVSDGNGIASLNINLPAGGYVIKTVVGDITRNNDIIIKKQSEKKNTWMEGTEINKTYGDDTHYQCAVYSDEGRVSGNVRLTINGRTYTKTPDSEGLYKLNINLLPGTYILRAEFNGNAKYKPSSIENNIIVNEKPAPTPTKSYEEELLEYFESIFGEVHTIDGALEKILSHGYDYYYDDAYSNRESIDRMADYEGINCTDSAHVFYNIAVALGYEVRCVHVGCSSGDGHVRLQLKHPVNTGGNWINRDPSAVLSDNGQDVTYNWCLNGEIYSYDPSWFMENLYR